MIQLFDINMYNVYSLVHFLPDESLSFSLGRSYYKIYAWNEKKRNGWKTYVRTRKINCCYRMKARGHFFIFFFHSSILSAVAWLPLGLHFFVIFHVIKFVIYFYCLGSLIIIFKHFFCIFCLFRQFCFSRLFFRCSCWTAISTIHILWWILCAQQWLVWEYQQ